MKYVVNIQILCHFYDYVLNKENVRKTFLGSVSGDRIEYTNSYFTLYNGDICIFTGRALNLDQIEKNRFTCTMDYEVDLCMY